VKPMDKYEFVNKCGGLLTIAKPNLIHCEYKRGKDIPPTRFGQILDDGEYVVVTAENGHRYCVDITSDSLAGIVLDVFTAMSGK